MVSVTATLENEYSCALFCICMQAAGWPARDREASAGKCQRLGLLLCGLCLSSTLAMLFHVVFSDFKESKNRCFKVSWFRTDETLLFPYSIGDKIPQGQPGPTGGPPSFVGRRYRTLCFLPQWLLEIITLKFFCRCRTRSYSNINSGNTHKGNLLSKLYGGQHPT